MAILNKIRFIQDEEEEDDEDVIKKGADEDEEEEMEGTKKDGIYRPPKLAPVYNGNKPIPTLVSALELGLEG